MYSVLYNKLVFDLLEKRFGKHEAVVFARASAAGGQRFPVVSDGAFYIFMHECEHVSALGR